MSKKPTDLDDIADAINGLATLMDQRFEQVDKRFEQVDKRFEQVDKRFEQVDKRFEQIDQRFNAMDLRFDRLETEQAKMRQWLERIDNRLTGIESDIEEIYDRIVALESKGPTLTRKDKLELEKKLAALFDWAKQVSKQTGIPLPKL